MNKDLWKRGIYNGACPEWPCPTCNAGVLLLDKDSLKEAATKASLAGQKEDWWGPEDLVYSFTAWATCSNQACGDKFALSGTGGVEAEPDENWNTNYVDVFMLKYCHPTLPIISVSANCPQAVRAALKAAFGLYWTDRPSTAGRIRVAVERLLDHLGIPDKSAKGGYLNLDVRIETFKKSDEPHGAQLMALKWLGNVGAHTVDVNNDDLLAAFEVLEHVLSEVIDKKSAAVAKLAEDLVKKYGKKP